MNKILLGIMMLSCALFVGCGAVHTIKDDAKNTPIGSVMTGETDDAGTYIHRVSEQNRNSKKDTWRPESKERF